MTRFDYALVGGGLQNGLVALALQHFQPASRVLLLEAASSFGGNHTWSFHAGDLPRELRSVVEPLVEHTWPSHDVAFPGFTRRIDSNYSTIPSRRLHAALVELAGRNSNFDLRLDSHATRVTSTHVTTKQGLTFEASIVVDSRGPEGYPTSKASGYQKFFGIEFEVTPRDPHAVPMLIDATVDQVDGFRFFYVLPLSARRLLVEDTYFSDSPKLNPSTLEAGIVDYLAAQNCQIVRRIRLESGVLPLPTTRVLRPKTSSGPLVGGYQGGWFHPTTGYSFPAAARLALEIARPSTESLTARLAQLTTAHERQLQFCTLLNRLLFDGFEPESRRSVFERFYRLPADTIGRFYALQLTRSDQLRIVCGQPPKGFRTGRLLDRITRRERNITGGLQ